MATHFPLKGLKCASEQTGNNDPGARGQVVGDKGKREVSLRRDVLFPGRGVRGEWMNICNLETNPQQEVKHTTASSG